MTIRCRDRKAYNQGRIVLNAKPVQGFDPRNHDSRPQKTVEELRRIIANRCSSN